MLQLVTTADGSKTIFNSEIGENYHSKHGALQESRHVFLNSGLRFYLQDKNPPEVKILEVGFGTGLNFLLSAECCLDAKLKLQYTGIEAYPLNEVFISQTGYQEYISEEIWKNFLEKYSQSINHPEKLNEYCSFEISHCHLADFKTDELYDIIYFDAFASVHQPEMWSFESLQHICNYLRSGGIFVTYAITGNLKRTMKALGFSVEKAKGAPGKREMLRARKF